MSQPAPARYDDHRLIALIDGSGDAFWELDTARRYVYAGESLARLLGCSSAELIGRSVLEGLAPEYVSEIVRLATARAQATDPAVRNGPLRHEGEIIRKDGSRLWAESVSVPVLDEAGNTLGYFGITRDMTQRRHAEQSLADAVATLKAQVAHNQQLQEQLLELASRDPLTGLYNRRHFLDAFDRELARAQRHGAPLALVMVDIDHFKQVNDGHGHAIGDDALRQVAELLRSTARTEDLACRLGGEEFAVLMPGMDLAGALARAEAWRVTLAAQPLLAEGAWVALTASMGVAVFPSHGEDVSTLLRSADRALYAAKAGGRNRSEAAVAGP